MILPGWESTAASTVMVAVPENVPGVAQPDASETAVTVYAVVVVGLTLRVAGLAATPVWVTASDHVTLHGPVPVRSA